jgi:hypothetical protein
VERTIGFSETSRTLLQTTKIQKGGNLVIKRILFVFVILVILSGFSGYWLNGILEVAGSLWDRIRSIITAAISMSDGT